MSPAEVKVIDELHNKLATRIAALVSDRLRESMPEPVCSLVFDKMTDALMEEGSDTLISILDSLLGFSRPARITGVYDDEYT